MRVGINSDLGVQLSKIKAKDDVLEVISFESHFTDISVIEAGLLFFEFTFAYSLGLGMGKRLSE